MVAVNNEKYIGVPLSWKQIEEYFPNTWVGLDVLEYDDPSEVNIKTARVVCTGTSNELLGKQLNKEINDSRCTIPEGIQIGVLI